MTNDNATQTIKVIAVIFIVSVIYALTSMYPNYGSSFDMGYATGSFFGHAIKLLGAIGLIAYGIKKIKKRGVRTLE